jgi:hypothetical protein
VRARAEAYAAVLLPASIDQLDAVLVRLLSDVELIHPSAPTPFAHSGSGVPDRYLVGGLVRGFGAAMFVALLAALQSACTAAFRTR